ncbi:Sfi1 spindle body protein-domain-containing protein [Apodospora peruviana]|uniref:Sfi1 spindle body protein-domain-containing protein n=1 Tax=Apodospora peruviana TaxID=516989 RepID=A0AAE0HXR3_9PEZI|nr:Sfi1 spindle body protein-domain-containing protein [Apodospora peruviana]
MPPHSSLPLRADGRAVVGQQLPTTTTDTTTSFSPPVVANTSQQQQHNEPFYSDEDVRLLYDIVELAESIYPDLPERDRLPTNALFQAAEQVLPDHGYDPDHAPSHISRLIFKIGGQRSGETLGDKFRSVLGGMGITIDCYPSSPPQQVSSYEQSPAQRSVSVRSVGIGAAAGAGTFSRGEDDDDQTTSSLEDFGGRRRVAPSHGRRQRRHSSVSRPLARRLFSPLATGATGEQYDLPIRPAPPTTARARSASFTDYDIDAQQHNNHLQEGENSSGDVGGGGLQALRKEYNDRRRLHKHDERPTNPVLRAAHALSRVTSGDYHPDEEEDDEPEDTTQDLPVLPFQAHVPVMERARKVGRDDGRFEVPVEGEEEGDTDADVSEAEPEDRTDNKELDASTAGDTADLVHHSGSDVFRGASDTTPQTQDEPQLFIQSSREELPDAEWLEVQLDEFRMRDADKLIRFSIANWRFNAILTKRDNEQLQQRAVEFDDSDMAAEVLDIWNEEAIAAQQERAEAEVAAKHAAYIAKMERRAQRVYEIFTIRNMLTHWQESAQDEVDRTAVARRHLVRKRAFDSWRAQHIEDETKVRNFVLINAIQKWSQVALHHEVRHQVAIQRSEKNAAEHAIRTMWEEHKGRLADAFKQYRLAEECVWMWSARTRDLLDEKDVAGALDERVLLDEAISIWREESEELQYRAYEGAMQMLGRGCLRDLEYWREQARLKRLLKQYHTARVKSLENDVLETWWMVTADAKQSALVADSLLLEGPVEHWACETKLKLFLDHHEEETKNDVLEHWYYEERLAWYKRRLEHNIKRQTLNDFLSATRQSRSDRVRAEDDADYEYTYFTQVEVVETWLAEAEAMWKPRHNANLVLLYRTTKPCLDVWRESHHHAVVRASFKRKEADKNAKRFVLSNVLDIWPGVAERARRERMMNTLREFRRNYKLGLAEQCLDRWWGAARDSLGSRRDADGVLVEHKREDIDECLEYWRYTAHQAQDIQEVAALAELEVYWGKYQAVVDEALENRQDAVHFDAEKTTALCWAKWEFHGIQREGMHHTVAAVRDKNDKRFCGRILEEWQLKAVPAASPSDLRFSTTLSRRSLRQQQAAAAAARSLGPAGYNNNYNYNNAASSTFTTPAAVGGGTAGYYQQGKATTTAHRVYTSNNSNNDGRNNSSSGNNNYFETPQPAPFPPVSQLGRGGDGRNRPLHFGSSTQTTTPGVGPPLPMAEFDDPEEEEEEDSLLMSLNPDGEDVDDLGFMSTPSRRLGRGRASQQRPLGYRPTTTPSAILASPYERELRRAYSGATGQQTTPAPPQQRGDSQQPQAQGRTTRVVEFADIREESAEG